MQTSYDWLTAFWSITREPEFCQIWENGDGEMSTTILVSILDYFQEKLMTIFLKKSKKPWGHFGPSLPNFGQK